MHKYSEYLHFFYYYYYYSAKLRASDKHPISPKTPAPQYQPLDRKKIKGKIVEDYNRDRAA